VAEAAPAGISQPMRHEIELRETLRKHERVVVTVVLGAGSPAGEPRALLECSVALTDELRLGYTDAGQRRAKCRPSALAYADDWRVRRFDERDTEATWHPVAMLRCNDAGGQP